MAGNSELWVQCFTCCLTARSARNGGRRSNNGSRPHQRHRIDRSMIGVPTNFRHTAHISSGDIDMSIAQLADLQTQMQRKGGDLGAKCLDLHVLSHCDQFGSRHRSTSMTQMMILIVCLVSGVLIASR
ncbi:hypothetical protein HN011_008848 [Eciton burchellii]|nr:hypothetical protein HN011_008848 [Eciton burchellii]